MSGYIKFAKDSMTKKRTVSFKPFDNVHHYNVIISYSLVEMKEDPRAFMI